MHQETSDFNPDWVSPPGDTIFTILNERKISFSEFAKATGLNIYEVVALIEGDREIDEQLAENLSSFLGSSKKFWLKRDAQYWEDKKRLGL